MTVGVVTLTQRLIFEALAGHAALNALVGARIYPDIAPQDTIKPYVVWFEYFTEDAKDLNGNAASGSLINLRVHITSWARSATQSRQVDMAVRGAIIAAATMKGLHTDARSLDYEPDTKLFGMQSDFSLWIRN